MAAGPLWNQMASQPRHPAASVTREEIPLDPGVYSVWRAGVAIYVGKATSLRDRVGKSHMGRGKSMRNSAFRRNVAEHLGIASANEIYKARYRLTEDELAQVRAFVDECELAWVTCSSPAEAVALEDAIKLEWMPELTKR